MRYVASCLIGLCACSTSAAAGQATGLPVNHRWIFDGASFALDGAYDQNDQANAQTTAFTAGLARKPFVFTATLAHNDSVPGISGGMSAAIVARPNEWAALGAAQVDVGYSAFGGVRRLRVRAGLAPSPSSPSIRVSKQGPRTLTTPVRTRIA